MMNQTGESKELSNKEYEIFKKFMSSLFPYDNYDSGNHAVKLQACFKLFVTSGWTVSQLKHITNKFARTHTLNYWMPGHFFQLFDNEYGD